MDWITIALWVAGIWVLLIGIGFGWQFLRNLLAVKAFFKTAEEYAGYSRKEVAQKKLFLEPSYAPRLLAAVQKNYPENLSARLRFFWPELLEHVPEIDKPILEETHQVFRLFVAACEIDNVYVAQGASARFSYLRQVVLVAAVAMEKDSITQRSLLKWHTDVVNWMNIASALIFRLKARINK